MMYRPFIVLLALTLVASCRQDHEKAESHVVAESTPQPSATDTSPMQDTSTGLTGGQILRMTAEEKDFVVRVAQAGVAEVSMAQMAKERGKDAAVLGFADRMLADHGKANDEMKQFATTKGIGLITELNDEQKAAAAHLASLDGKPFDRAYMQHMVTDHEKAVSDFEKAATFAVETDLKAWVDKTLPTLREHLRMARETSAKLK